MLACARHSARVRPRRGSGTVAARTAGRTPGGAVMTEAITDPRVVQAAPHGRGPGCRHRRTHRRSRTGGARLRRHGLRTSLRTSARPGRRAGGHLSARQARRPRRLPVLNGRPVHGGSPAELRPFPGRRGTSTRPRAGGCGRARLPLLPGLLPPHLGPVPTHPGLPAHRAGSRRGPLDADLTHRSWTTSGGWSPRAPRWKASRRSSFPARRHAPPPNSSPPQPSSRNWASPRVTYRPSSAGWCDYLVTSPLRRASELQNLSAYDFFVGRDGPDGSPRFTYSPRFDARSAGDAAGTGGVRHALGRCPHQPHHLSPAPAADGSPRQQGRRRAQRPHHRIVVRPLVPPSHRSSESVSSTVRPHRLEPAAFDPQQPPHLRPRVQVTLADGTRLAPDYTVVAVDAPAAERITASLRNAGTGGDRRRAGRVHHRPPLRPTARCSPRRPARMEPAGPLRDGRDGAKCRGTGSRRWAVSSTTSTRSSSCFEGTCTTRERSGRCRRSTSTACGRRDRS